MPTNFSKRERNALLKVLKYGRNNAITAKTLAPLLNYSTGSTQVQLRKLIKECIEVDHDLIGSVTGRPAGFFKINSLNELEDYIDSLENRTRSDNTRRTALLNSWNNSHSPASTRNILSLI